MKMRLLLLLAGCASGPLALAASDTSFDRAAETAKYLPVIREHIQRDYPGMFRAEGGAFKYPFLAPGSAQYSDILWDWDSWLSDVALRQVLLEKGTAEDRAQALRYELGCVLN